MPGRDYGPGGKWIHDRAHRIMEESPGTPKSIAYATATQQAHKVGKSPKGFRTPEGMATAKAKFDRPKKEYQKTAAAPAISPLKPLLAKDVLARLGKVAPTATKSVGSTRISPLQRLMSPFQKTGAATPEERMKKLIEALPEEFKRALVEDPGSRPPEKTASSCQAPPHPFEFTLKGVLIKEALGKKKLQQAEKRKRQIKTPLAGKYESPSEYVKRMYREKGVQDPGETPKAARSAREQARAAGIEQPYTARQRAAGVPPPKKKAGPRVEQKPPKRGRVRPQGAPPKSPPTPPPSAATSTTKTAVTPAKVSRLRKLGPIGLGVGLAGAAGLAAYLASRKKKQHEAEIEKFWGKKKAAAVMGGLMDELEKIAQGGGSLANRIRLGATGPGAQASLANLTGGGDAGAATSSQPPPPPPPAPAPTASPGGSGLSASDVPGSDPFGGAGAPGGGNPMGGSNIPPPPPPTGGAGGAGAGSLLSPQRRRGPGTGTLSASESAAVAPPSASEFGG